MKNKIKDQFEHHYGKKVHLVSDLFSLELLSRLGHPDCHQPLINQYVEFLYKRLLIEAINTTFPSIEKKVETRMKAMHPKEGFYKGPGIDQKTFAVSINLARAGTFPSQICYTMLNYLLPPNQVRQDHFYVNRKVNDKGQVVGVDVSGSKIGGDETWDYDKTILLFPDPMGATGGTLCHAAAHYKKNVSKKIKKILALHLIVTPEYIQKVTSMHPEVEIFALRLDRGLSAKDILDSPLGKFKEKEKGLNDIQYIVPGAGGLGEILNNSYV